MQMWFKNISILIFVSIVTSDFTFAQRTPEKTDSIHVYENIETYSKRNKFSTFIYQLIFKPVKAILPKKKTKKKVNKNLIQKPYSSFEGKIIRQINIETLDPFGYSVDETLVASQNFISSTGNKLHIKSQPVTIRNLLLIRPNQPFDALLVKESERLVRSRGYVHDVLFYVTAASKNSDSVDIFIRELDNWSIIPQVSVSASSTTINLADKNFMGMGHEFQNVYTRHLTERNNSFSTSYSIPSIRNTFISTKLHYSIDGYNNFDKSLTFDRPFFSPFAKWAAGVSFAQKFYIDSIQTSDSHFVIQRFKFNIQDYWAGSAIRIFKGNTETDRTTNFITALRFSRIRYLEKPMDMFVTQPVFSNEDFYLASIGISTRKYVQDKFIFKFGVTEDVPNGKVFSLTVGYQNKKDTGRLYVGSRISLGNYFSWGYLSYNFEYGTYINSSHPEQGAFTAGINYFTGLVGIGKWKFRQFIKPQVTIGINRFSNDSLTINDNYGLDGFNSSSLTGTSRLLLTLQTQSYARWSILGFSFGPYLICSFGMLGDALTGFKNSRVYSQLGLGVLIKNENLVFKNFHISIAFYPIIPGKGRDIFKLNSFRTTDFGFRDFVIGKPQTMVFQ